MKTGPLLAMFLCLSARAATNDIPVLRPPRGEMTSSFWLQYGWLCILAGVTALVLLTLGLRSLLRPHARPAQPFEMTVCQNLERLRERRQDGTLVSEVSRILREYLHYALELPPDELTTTEFREALRAHPLMSMELATQTVDFLAHCDRLKFAPAQDGPPLDSVSGALKLIGRIETNRRQAVMQGQAPPRAA